MKLVWGKCALAAKLGMKQKNTGMTLSENTHIRLGFVGAILAIVFSILMAVVGAIWWAATVNAKLDSVLLMYQSLNTADAGHISKIEDVKSKMDDVKERVRQLELVGSPHTQELEKRVLMLEKGTK